MESFCPLKLAKTLMSTEPQTWQDLLLAANALAAQEHAAQKDKKKIERRKHKAAPGAIQDIKELIETTRPTSFALSDIEAIACGARYHAIAWDIALSPEKPVTMADIYLAFQQGMGLTALGTMASKDRLRSRQGKGLLILNKNETAHLFNQDLPPNLEEDAAIAAIDIAGYVPYNGGADPEGKTARRRKKQGLTPEPRQVSPTWLANFRALVAARQPVRT